MWPAAVVLAGSYIIYSVSERYLSQQFAGTHLRYEQSTKVLLPLMF
jgi:protein-S-isoprenylcysteine O-methyltransferase Ste14